MVCENLVFVLVLMSLMVTGVTHFRISLTAMIRSQHSLECHDPHRQCFMCLRTLTFRPQNKWVSRHLAAVFEISCGKADRHVSTAENPTHVTTVSLGNDIFTH